jgi:hypothetical protein
MMRIEMKIGTTKKSILKDRISNLCFDDGKLRVAHVEISDIK